MNKLAELRKKILESSSIAGTDTLSESKAYEIKEDILTTIPILNIAFSGDIDRGMCPGILQIAGPSKHFKTGFALALASAFLNKFEDGMVLFYDSEGGAKQLFKAFGIDEERVIISQVATVEQTRSDIAIQLKKFDKSDKVLIVLDSLGNLASEKEINDALSQSDKADMTRAKNIKSLFRIMGPGSIQKDIYSVIINHTYKEQTLYPKDIPSGGTGPYYNSNEIWIVGRQQDKDGKELEGFNFVINIEKSRTIKEKSRFLVNVSLKDGIQKYSGLWELAEELGIIKSPAKGWYSINEIEKFRRAEVENSDKFWNEIFTKTEFKELVKKRYQFDGNILQDE